MKNESKFSVLIKTFNSENTIINTLESVCSFGEIIAIDMHSSDDTLDILKEYKVKVIFSDKVNPSEAYNQALFEAQGDWILVLEDDEIPPENLLNELVNYSKNPKKNKFSVSFTIKTFYLNKEIKSAKRKNVIKFFKKEYCDFKNDNSYELNLKQGKTFKLKNESILKYLQSDISKFIENAIYKNKNILKFSNKITSSVVIRPILEFIYYYIFKFGFMDGLRGYIFAKEKAFEKFILEVMFLEKKFKEKK